MKEGPNESDNQPWVFQWSTDSLPAADRLDAYVGAICEQFLNVTTSSQELDFHSELAIRSLGPLLVAKMGGSSQDAYRTVRHIARSTDHGYHLVIGQGNWTLRYPDRDVQLRPGDIVMTDSRFAHSAHWTSGCTALNVRIPLEWLSAWVPEPRKLVGQRIAADGPWAGMLGKFVNQLSPEHAGKALPLAENTMADQIGALLAMAAEEVPGAVTPRTPTHKDMVECAVDVIQQRCSELQLTAADVAETLGISVRTLHRMLSGHDQSFGSLLIGARAEVARRMLEAPGFDRLTTQEIGRRAGFTDASHFARVCASRFGRRPSDFRRERNRSL